MACSPCCMKYQLEMQALPVRPGANEVVMEIGDLNYSKLRDLVLQFTRVSYEISFDAFVSLLRS